MKLFQFTFCIIVNSLCFIIANAQIVYTDVNPDATYNSDGIYNLDLNNDGTKDFALSRSSYTGTVHCTACTSPTTTLNVSIYLTPLNINEFSEYTSSSQLSQSILIDSSLFWSNNQHTLYSRALSNGTYCIRGHCVPHITKGGDWNPSSTNTYLGLRIHAGLQTYYGWVRMDVESSGSLTIKDYAYNSTSGQPILAGDSGNCIHNGSTLVETACDSYNLNSQIYTSTGVYTQTLTNGGGCDSIVTFYLTINKVDTSVTIIGNILTSNATGATYQWVDCNNGYTALAGETNQSFTPVLNGYYAVVVTTNACSDTSFCYSINSVGIFENTLNNNITIYPNPSTGNFSIDLYKQSPVAEVTIINAFGQEVSRAKYCNTSRLELEIKGESGLYFVKVVSGEKSGVCKVVKM